MTNTAVTVDVGNNVTALLDKLAQQIGVTAQQVFPWYVKQAYISGWICLVTLVLTITASLCMAVWAFKKTDDPNTSQNTIEGYEALCVCACAAFCLTLLFGICGGFSWFITGIVNPEYHAMRSILTDLTQLSH